MNVTRERCFGTINGGRGIRPGDSFPAFESCVLHNGSTFNGRGRADDQSNWSNCNAAAVQWSGGLSVGFFDVDAVVWTAIHSGSNLSILQQIELLRVGTNLRNRE